MQSWRDTPLEAAALSCQPAWVSNRTVAASGEPTKTYPRPSSTPGSRFRSRQTIGVCEVVGTSSSGEPPGQWVRPQRGSGTATRADPLHQSSDVSINKGPRCIK